MTLQNQTLSHRLFRGDLATIFYISLVRLLLHFLVNLFGGYGFFRDELYYLACSDHLAMGYVDQPPLSIYLLKFSRLFFGDSLFAIRMLPAIAGAVTVFLTGLMVKEFEGKKFAQILACLCAFSLGSIAMSSFYSMNSFDILLWTIAAYVMIRIIKTNNPRLWILLGVILGLGLMNKIGVLFLGAGVFFGLILTPQRQWLKTPWPYVAGGITFILFLPYIIWNVMHDFAHLEFIRNASAEKYSSQSPVRFLKEQVLINNPVAVLVWLPGLLALFFSSAMKPFRLIGYLYVVPLIIFLLNGTSKAEYLIPGYAILWASGGVVIEKFTAKLRAGMFIRMALPVLITGIIVVFSPMILTILPVETYIRYADKMGFAPNSSENKELSELPQFYADMFGWEEKANAVAEVFKTLPPEDQKICSVFSYNYGRCGAIDFFGRKLGIPRAIGLHNNYWIWGPGNATGEVVIILGGDMEDLITRFEDVKEMRRVSTKYCMPYENNLPVFVCRRIKIPFKKLWPEIKSFQ